MRAGVQTLDTGSAYRFGLSPHLASSQTIDVGIPQHGADQNSGLRINAALSQDLSSPADAHSYSEMESIEPIEIQDHGTGSNGTTTDQDADDHPSRHSVRRITSRETITQRYPDGKPQIEREVAQDQEGNYFNDGAWRVKSLKGAVIAEGHYREGIMHGTWQRQHSAQSGGLFSTKPFNLFQGPFLSSATFQNGKLDGMWTLADAYERKVFEVPYRNGKRHGTATWWYPSLNKMREVTFKDGLLDGKLQEWDEQAKLTRDEEYLNGQKIVRNVTYYRPKQKETENYFLDGKLVLSGDDNWWEAEPAPMVTEGQRVQHGPANAWYDNGLPKMKGQYDRGQRVGRFTWWHSNGNKQLEGVYDDGRKSGRWTWWHDNGMKAIEGHYESDQAVGAWRWWKPSGKLESSENLSNEGNRLADPTSDSTDNSDLDSETLELDRFQIDSGLLDDPEILPDGNPETKSPGMFVVPQVPDASEDSSSETEPLEDVQPLESNDSSAALENFPSSVQLRQFPENIFSPIT